jgi:hypothetical protein
VAVVIADGMTMVAWAAAIGPLFNLAHPLRTAPILLALSK